MVLQILVKNKQNQIVNEYRYSQEKELLYRQNRSYDFTIPSYEWQAELNFVIYNAEKINCYIQVNEIEENTLWEPISC